MRGLASRWQERRLQRANAAYLAEEVELIDLAALEREQGRSSELDLRDPVVEDR